MERSDRRDAAEAAESGKEETAADFRRTAEFISHAGN